MPINQEDFILRFKTDTRVASADLERLAKQAIEVSNLLDRATGGSKRTTGGGLVDAQGREFQKTASLVQKAQEQLTAATTAASAKRQKTAKTEADIWVAQAQRINKALESAQRSIETTRIAGKQVTADQLAKLQEPAVRGVALAGAAPASITAAETAALKVNSQAIIDNTSKAIANIHAKEGAAKAAALQATKLAAEDAAVNRLSADLQRQLRLLNERQVYNQRPNINVVNNAKATAESLVLATNGIERFRDKNILASQAVADLTTKQAQLKPRVDASTQAFTRHALTIAQGLVVYNAFGTALQGVRDAIQIVIDIGIETQRLGLVLGGLSKTDANEFLRVLGNTAVQTNTSFVDLVANTDLVAGALSGFGKQDAQSRLQLINDFQRLAGEFSNVVGIGADLGIVDKQLVDLFNIFKGGFSGIEDFRTLLNQIVVLNHRNATGIQITTDALEASGLAASRAGFNTELLTSIFAKLAFSTQKSGQEIGGLFTTVLSKLQDPAIVGKISELSQGVIKLTDSFGNLRPAAFILAEIATHQKELEALAPGRLAEIIKALGQQINPGAAAFNEKVVQATLQAVQEAATAQNDYTDALRRTNEALSETLSFKFGAFIQRLTVGIQSFQESLSGVLSGLLGFADSVVDVISLLGPSEEFTKLNANLSDLNKRYAEGKIDVDEYTAASDKLNARIESLGPGLGVLIVQVLAFLAAIGLVNTVGGKLLSFFGAWTAEMRQTFFAAARGEITILGLARAESAAAVATNELTAAQARLALSGVGSKFGAMGTAAGIAAVAVRGLTAALSSLWPILLIVAGIEIVSNLAQQAEQIDNLVKRLGLTRVEAERLIHPPQPTIIAGKAPQLIPVPTGTTIPLPGGREIAAPVTDQQKKTLDAYLSALTEIIKQNDAVGGSEEELAKKIKLATDALVDSTNGYKTTANSAQFFISASESTASSADDLKVKLADLNEEFLAGKIAPAEYNKQLQELQKLIDQAEIGDLKKQYDETGQGLDQLNAKTQAYIEKYLAGASATSDMTDAQLLEAKAQQLLGATTQAAGQAIQALTKQYIQGKIGLEEYNTGLTNIEQAHEDAARLVAVFGDALRQQIPSLQSAKAGNEALTAALLKFLLQAGNIAPIQQLIDQLIKAGTVYGAVARTFAANPLTFVFNFNRAIAQVQAFLRVLPPFLRNALLGPFQSLITKSLYSTSTTVDLSALNKAILDLSRTNYATANPATAASIQQPNILDIGELSPSQLTQIVAIATRLRNAIPGETAADKGEVVNLIKDAQFLTSVKDIDERLLRIAIEELTRQMEEANRLKQKDQILQNLVVKAGPLSALISQPTTFGVGGTLASGTGLNFDPTKGNFTINVPIELSGLDPAKLQQLVYNIIYDAIRDALRL